MTGWRLPVRMARRELGRARGRAALMLVMIALPVIGVTTADIIIQTQDVTSVESLDRRLGTVAAAEVTASGSPAYAVQQSIDPDRGGSGQVGDSIPDPTLASVLATLGGDRRGLARITTYPLVRTDKGFTMVGATALDLADPLARGLFRLTDGRLPRSADEVDINRSLADRGFAIGDSITLSATDDSRSVGSAVTVTRTIVGVAESTETRNLEQVVGLPGSVPAQSGAEISWLISGGPVRWSQVRAVNAIGALVVSRDVVEHPSAAALAAENEFGGGGSGVDQDVVTVAVLIVVMALIEVVLLAGPAFAVGARRQSRSLALLAAAGGTPGQARRVVVATGIVVGVTASALGVVLGIGLARALVPWLSFLQGQWYGPFQVPWLHLLGVAAFGFVSAVLAAVVPAWIASRQDVVAVLAGRRGDRKPSTRSPLIGVLLIGIGIALAVVAATQVDVTAAISISLSAISCVLGMLFLVPVVTVGVARLGRWFPLWLRFAVRDAARHRTRTTPAVAAVAASVAGVIALGIGVSSDAKENEATYVPSLPGHRSSLQANADIKEQVPWKEYEAVLSREAPGVTSERVLGTAPVGKDGSYLEVSFTGPQGEYLATSSYMTSVGTGLLVDDGKLPDYLSDLPGFDAGLARRTLDAGGVVLFTDSEDVRTATITVQQYPDDGGEPSTVGAPLRVATVALHLGLRAPAQAILPAAVARRLGLTVGTVGLVTGGPQISEKQEKNISEALNAIDPPGYLQVERGYQAPDDVRLVQWVLAGLGALLMLGGTLTATFLALSDARPDLATLSAVGAAPRTRRAVAAGYALSVGVVGALLGIAVGFVPGIAATYPLTGRSWACSTECSGPDHYLAIPWLLIGGVAVVLPLLVAAVVGLTARSRLPLVSRLD